jgi:hypothetical protein
MESEARRSNPRGGWKILIEKNIWSKCENKFCTTLHLRHKLHLVEKPLPSANSDAALILHCVVLLHVIMNVSHMLHWFYIAGLVACNEHCTYGFRISYFLQFFPNSPYFYERGFSNCSRYDLIFYSNVLFPCKFSMFSPLIL